MQKMIFLLLLFMLKNVIIKADDEYHQGIHRRQPVMNKIHDRITNHRKEPCKNTKNNENPESESNNKSGNIYYIDEPYHARRIDKRLDKNNSIISDATKSYNINLDNSKSNNLIEKNFNELLEQKSFHKRVIKSHSYVLTNESHLMRIQIPHFLSTQFATLILTGHFIIF